MDSDGLPIVGTGIDLTKVGAIHQKRTIAFLNHFITHTARFLNRFSCVCEDKLSTLSLRIQRLETTMSILEAKLSSIPGLENVTVETSSASQTSTTEGQQQSQSSQEGSTSHTQSQPQPAPTQEESVKEAEEEKPTMTVSKDPRYARFFKMADVGVPLFAVKQKMEVEGLNPDLLDTPNAPAPPSDTKDDSMDDEDDDLSEEQGGGDSDDSSSDFSD